MSSASLRSRTAKSWCPSNVRMEEAAAAALHHSPKRVNSALLVGSGLRIQGGIDRGREVVVGGQSGAVAVHELGDLILQRPGRLLLLRGGLALRSELRLGGRLLRLALARPVQGHLLGGHLRPREGGR